MKFISFLLVLLFANYSFATTVTTLDGTVCDFSKTVHNADGTVTYPADLHNCVGKIVQDTGTQAQQIVEYKKAIDLYKITIQTDEQRIQNWINTSISLEARMEKVDELASKNQWLYFGLGVLATGAAAYTAAKLSGH